MEKHMVAFLWPNKCVDFVWLCSTCCCEGWELGINCYIAVMHLYLSKPCRGSKRGGQCY